MKKVLGTCLLSLMLLSCTGCMRAYQTLTPNTDGTISVINKMAVSKEYVDSTGQPDPGSVLETLEDGKAYYSTTTAETLTAAELRDGNNLTATRDIFYYEIGTDTGNSTTDDINYSIAQALASNVYAKITVNMGDAIVETNANVTADTKGNTVAFDTTNTAAAWYAYTAHGKQLIETDTVAPAITGIKKSKVYNSVSSIKYSDNVGVASVTLNGKAFDNTSLKQGTNTLVVTDIKGNSTTASFKADLKKPTIKGIKNGKSYSGSVNFSVKDNQKLAKVTIDGKKQTLKKKGGSYKFTITKKGKHTIKAYDKAGNTKTVKIKIK